jgi:hypothetical protein
MLMQKRQTCMPTSLLYSLQQRGRSAHRPRRRPRRGVLPSPSNSDAEQNRHRQGQHHEQKDKSETDIARHIRDYTYDSGADEGRRLVGEGEEGEEGGFVALRG